MKKISEIGERYGVNPSTIRGWERRGIIKFKRDWAGRRVFDDKAVERIKEIMNRPERSLTNNQTA
jgi:DNA-binding transcriptional MerR regulator